MTHARIVATLIAPLLALGMLPAAAGASPGGDRVEVCKYTGTPGGSPSHVIEVNENALRNGGFADAHDSVVAGETGFDECKSQADAGDDTDDENDNDSTDDNNNDGTDDTDDENDNDSTDDNSNNDDDNNDGTDDDDNNDGTDDDNNDDGTDDDNNDDNNDGTGTGTGTGTGSTEVADTLIERVAGNDRIETAIEVSQSTYEDGTDAVVLARSDLYPDALTGGPFAYAIDAPILLSTPEELHSGTAAEIQRLEATTVYLLGGTAALSEDVERHADELATVETVERIGGLDRFGTAKLIAEELLERVDGSIDSVYVTEGINADPTRGWPDAVAVSGLASHEGRPILLSGATNVPSATTDALRTVAPSETVLVGGEAALDERVVATLEGTGVETDRIGGATRYETSARIAERSVEAGLERTPVWLATGLNWPDALVAGPAVAADGGVLMLIHGADADRSPAAVDWLADNQFRALEADIDDVTLRFIGGSAAISPTVIDALR